MTATLQEFLTESGLSSCPEGRGDTRPFRRPVGSLVSGKLFMHARVTQHLDKWVELSRHELWALCAMMHLTPGILNKNNDISNHHGGASAPLPRTSHSGGPSSAGSVLRKGLLTRNLIEWPH